MLPPIKETDPSNFTCKFLKAKDYVSYFFGISLHSLPYDILHLVETSEMYNK